MLLLLSPHIPNFWETFHNRDDPNLQIQMGCIPKVHFRLFFVPWNILSHRNEVLLDD